MNRRTVLKRVGAATAGTVALTGNAAANRAVTGGVTGELDATIDVSAVAGEVPLADVLTDEQLADLDGDPSTVRLAVDAGVDEIAPILTVSSLSRSGPSDRRRNCHRVHPLVLPGRAILKPPRNRFHDASRQASLPETT